MGHRMVGAQFDGALEVRGHLIHAIERAPGQRDVVVIIADTIVELDGFADEFHGGCGIAALQGKQAEIVQAVGVIGIEREDVTVTALGLGERAGLMLRHGRGEQAAGVPPATGGGAARRCAKRAGTSPFFATHDTDRSLKRTWSTRTT